MQLKEVEVRVECGRTGTTADAAKPPKFDETTSWAVFCRQFQTVAEQNCWTRLEKSIFLIIALEGRATDVLHGVSKGPAVSENRCKNLPQSSNS
jgi:hypothetical protein